MKGHVSLAAAGLVAASVGVVLAAQQLPVFRSEATYVEVSARVVDRDGKLIDGLTAADFELREDHQPQRVETAFRVNLPTPWARPATTGAVLYRPGLASNLQVANGRIYLLYLNAVRADHVAITRKLATDFVDTYLMPEDVVALWDDRAGLVTFTNEKERLHRYIAAFLGTSETLTAPVKGTADAGRIEPTLNSALDWFSSVQGRRKSVLLFSAGWAGLAPVTNDQGSALSTQTDLVDRPDVQIYIVDTRGLVTPNSSIANQIGGAAYAIDRVNTENAAIFNSVNDLRWSAEDTGGFAIVNHNEYQDGFRRIVDENSQYYVLGYQSNRPKRPNWEYREISVKVKKPGLDGVRVQARKGYVAR